MGRGAPAPVAGRIPEPEIGLIAFGLCVVLFAFWSVLGYAVVRAARVRMDPLAELLVAPVVGVVVLTIPLFLLNRLGLPVSRFTYPLTIGLVVAAGVPMLLARRKAPWRQWFPFGTILLLALLAAGWPMLEFGFDWLSLCNDDMANYCLGAGRFYHYGFFHAPTPQDLIAGTDYTQFYWFLHVPGMVRPGVELILAWVMALTQLEAHEIFMPTVVAFHLCQVSALGALMHQSPKTRVPALAGCALLAASALATFGALYQLIAQVYGMALIAGTAAVLLRPYAGPDVEPIWRRGLLGGLLGAGLFLLYPEVIPIVGGSWLLYLLTEALHRRLSLKAIGVFVGAALVIVVVLLGRQALGIAGFMYGQASAGSAGAVLQDVFFPFYQLPSGVADFWGFFPLTYVPPEPIGSFAIAVAALLLLSAVGAAAWMAKRGAPVGIVAFVMLCLAAFLVVRGAHFGLYKIAMFLQPFVLGTIALAAFSLFKRPRTAVIVLTLIALPGLVTQQVYVIDSRGTAAAGGFPEIADPTRSRINHDFRRVLAEHAALAQAGGLVCDTSNIVLAKFESYYTRGYRAVFPGSTVGISMLGFTTKGKSLAPKNAVETAEQVHDGVKERLRRFKFNLHESDDPKRDRTNGFQYPEVGPFADPNFVPGAVAPTDETLLLVAGPKQSILNRWGARRRMGHEADDRNFLVRPFHRVRDHLVFVESDLGRSYFMSHFDVSMYQLEPDPIFYRRQTMAGVGRRFMFQVLQPTEGVRLVVELSSSLNADADNRLPDADAISDQRHKLGMTGRGSARVFSPPLKPQVLGGRSFVGLDLNQDAEPFRQQRGGLMRLYGLNVSLDRRMLVCFARDISALSERQFDSLRPPSSIGQFPRDLQNLDVEYSGFYEDGWVSDRAWCGLGQPWDAKEVVVRGWVPELDDASFQTEVTLRVDGRDVAKQTVGLKGFELRGPLPAELTSNLPLAEDGAGPRRRVELAFSKLQNLPRGDKRPVGCLVTHLGFGAAPAPPVLVQKFPDDFHAYPLLASEGLDPDGWVRPKVSMQLTQAPRFEYLKVSGMVPQIGDANFTTGLKVLVDGQPVAERQLRVGGFELAVPVAERSQPGARRVTLEFSAAQNLPGDDARTVAARVTSIGFAPKPLPPRRLERLPEDLRHPLAEASGIYDDGWVGQTASFNLAQTGDAEFFAVSGMVPQIGDAAGFATGLVILIDGEEVERRTLGPGQFDIRIPVATLSVAETARRVELKFSANQQLPSPDGRPVSARLAAVRFGAGGE